MANLTTVFQESSEPVRLSRTECSLLPGEAGIYDLFPNYLQDSHLSCIVAVEVMQSLDKVVRDLVFFFSDCFMTTGIARSIVSYVRRCSSTPVFSLSLCSLPSVLQTQKHCQHSVNTFPLFTSFHFYLVSHGREEQIQTVHWVIPELLEP